MKIKRSVWIALLVLIVVLMIFIAVFIGSPNVRAQYGIALTLVELLLVLGVAIAALRQYQKKQISTASVPTTGKPSHPWRRWHVVGMAAFGLVFLVRALVFVIQVNRAHSGWHLYQWFALCMGMGICVYCLLIALYAFMKIRKDLGAGSRE